MKNLCVLTFTVLSLAFSSTAISTQNRKFYSAPVQYRSDDDVAVTTSAPEAIVADEEIVSNDEIATTQVPEEFPPPFLKEPLADEVEEKEMQDNRVPPNFDATKHENVSIRIVGNSAYYVGKANCECGRKGIRVSNLPFNDTKIVNGEPARIEEYPWTVGLLRKSWLGTVGRTPYCGGTLINNQYIITASHCVDNMSARSIVAILHEEDFSSSNELEESTVKIQIEKIIMHPQYSRRTIDNDIALLKLETPVELGQVFIPACLPANNDYTFEGEVGTAAGWGATSEGGGGSSALRKVDVPIISNNDCNTKTKYEGKITVNMLCAGYIEEGGKDSCQGDSGGPLVIENGGRRTLVGVVSWGYGCAKERSPGVYTRTGRYPEWILANTPGGDWCSG